MATELFTNQASTTVSSGGTTAPAQGTVETWTVASSASFPAAASSANPPTQFHVADPLSAATAAEIIAVTNVSGTTWTVTRGAEGTAPVAHAAGFTVQQVISAAGLTAFLQSVYQPWQFQPESYGAKRDGAFLYDAAMTNGSAVLTTAGLPAPSAPSVSNSGTGGTVAAGTYQVKITYVNAHGETLASSATSTTTSGTTSTITITSPAPWTNATGWYAYVTQAGGSSFTRQQAAGSPTALRTSLVITAPPTSTGAAPPVANTSASAPFTSADVGKHIIVPSAGGFLNVPLVTTIASYQSASQVTLANAASSSVTGYGALYGTDDTAAIQSAINAAVAYAQGSEQALGEVVFGNGTYCVSGALTGTYQNAQLTIPYVDPYAGPKVNLLLTGPCPASGPAHWEQANPVASGAVIASVYYSDSGSPPTPNPAVIGGPVTGFGGNGGLFSNMRLVVSGLNILVAYRPSITGLDLAGVGQAYIKSLSYSGLARPNGASAGGWPNYQTTAGGNPCAWPVVGYKAPTVGNNDFSVVDQLTVYGAANAVVFTDHFTAQSIRSVFVNYGAYIYGASDGHHCFIGSLSCEVANAAIFVEADSARVALSAPSVQVETINFIVQDSANVLYGEVRAEDLPGNLTGLIAGGKSGAANVRLIWNGNPLGPVASPPSVPASTAAFTNQFWHDAVVIVSGGTVTAVALDGKTTGRTSGDFFVRSGGTITLTYSVAPTWQWVLA